MTFEEAIIKVTNMKYTTIEELEDKILGPIGTPKRDAFEAEVNEAIRSYREQENSIKRKWEHC